MSSRMIAAAGTALSLLAAVPALASPCTERINALEARINEAAEAAGSTSSGGQGVAAARESQAIQQRNQNKPVAPQQVPPFQNEAKEAQTAREAAEAGGGGDRVMQARAKLNEARTVDSRGDSRGCIDMIEQAERQLERR